MLDDDVKSVNDAAKRVKDLRSFRGIQTLSATVIVAEIGGNSNSVEQKPRCCDAFFCPPAPKSTFTGCVPAEPTSVSFDTLMLIHDHCREIIFSDEQSHH